MSSKKKRYQNPLEVRLEIVRIKGIAAADLRRAERLEYDLDEVRLDPDINDRSKELQCNELRKHVNLSRKHHSFLLERKIPMLIRVLAKLNTHPMEFMGESSEMEEVIK